MKEVKVERRKGRKKYLTFALHFHTEHLSYSPSATPREVTIFIDRETEASSLKWLAQVDGESLGTWHWIQLSLQNHGAPVCRSVFFFLVFFLWHPIGQRPMAVHHGRRPIPPGGVLGKFCPTSPSWLAGSQMPMGQSSGRRWWRQPRAQPATSDTMRRIRDGLCSPTFEVPSFYQSVWTLTLFQGSFYYCLWTGLR